MTTKTTPPLRPTLRPGTCPIRSGGKPAAAFTLIELLTVIAIIALLAAILFPVFGRVRESARQATCINNLRQIQAAVGQYRLDRGQYPDYLFGPALDVNGCMVGGNGSDCGGQTPGAAISPQAVAGLLSQAANSNATAPSNYAKTNYLNSLYPGYIKSIAVFHCPDDVNDSVSDATKTFPPPGNPNNYALVTRLAPTSTETTPATQSYTAYLYDSYDASPLVNAATSQYQLEANTDVDRYARLWFNMDSGVSTGQTPQPFPSGADPNAPDHDLYVEYTNQLRFREPSGDTMVTMCPYHSGPSGKILVLFLDGTVKVEDASKLKDKTPGTAVESGVTYDFDTFKILPTD